MDELLGWRKIEAIRFEQMIFWFWFFFFFFAWHTLRHMLNKVVEWIMGLSQNYLQNDQKSFSVFLCLIFRSMFCFHWWCHPPAYLVTLFYSKWGSEVVALFPLFTSTIDDWTELVDGAGFQIDEVGLIVRNQHNLCYSVPCNNWNDVSNQEFNPKQRGIPVDGFSSCFPT